MSGNDLLAKPVFTNSKYLIAVLSANATGTVSPGTEAYPLVYYLERDAESALETDYWIIEEQENNHYSFRNASTSKYIRHDVSASEDRSALVLTDALEADKSTLFTLELKVSGNLSYYTIRSVVAPAKVWNKRASTYDSLYPVGVYDGSGNANECFIFYDLEGNSAGDDAAGASPLPAVGKTLGAFQNQADSIRFNSQTPVVDASQQEFYVTIPESEMGGNVSMKVHYKLKNTLHTLFIDNKPVTSGNTFNFGTVSASTNFPIEIRNGSAVVASGTLYFSCLPLVQIYTESTIGSVYNLSKLSVTEPELTDSAEVLYMKIKIRGASSASLPKKSYAVKLKDADGETSLDRSFFGLRDDNNWILDAMYIDPARMRNRVSTDLWNDFATKPYFSSDEPKLINGTRGRFVEVFINDAYHGLYCMTEKVDRKQLKLKKFEASAASPPVITQRGGLYKGSGWAPGTLGGGNTYGGSMPTYYNNNSETWSGFEVKYPDLGDGEPIDWKPLVDAITVSSHLTNDADFKSKVATYYDLPVFLDYYLFIELMLASDNQGKNTYFSVYNQKKSPMVTVTPWDCDGVWGRRWDGSSGLTGANQDFDTFISNHEHAQNNLFLRLKSLNYDDYRIKLKSRYEELRGTYFSHENLMGRFERYHDQFVQSGADVRERNKWPVGNFNNEMQFLSTWIQARLVYLDNQYLGGPYVAPSTATENLATSGVTFAPNPVRDVLTISNSSAGDIIRIVSLQGTEMTRIQSTGHDVLVDMARYTPGIYLLKIGDSVAKIIKWN
ncbi:hypothetical protein AGMMS49525_12650 [Bacteroidia bacterium]|nr:hypothetical protein AGMMS49525_12650 [Bacteroidia bacterium]